jgi:hypothetical protein
MNYRLILNKIIPGMNNRRKFIVQSSLAATALLAAKPFNTFAKYASPLSSAGFNYNSITFLHAAGPGIAVAAQVKKITNKTASIILSHADNEEQQLKQPMNCDASLHSINENEEGGYKIIFKDNIRAGVITANANEQDLVNRINHLSAFLKNEKDCHIVVCISELGYKNKNRVDDITLAGNSENIDIIVGKHAANSPKRPIIALNKKRAEVIIHHTENSTDALGKIKIGFNQSGVKYNVSF